MIFYQISSVVFQDYYEQGKLDNNDCSIYCTAFDVIIVWWGINKSNPRKGRIPRKRSLITRLLGLLRRLEGRAARIARDCLCLLPRKEMALADSSNILNIRKYHFRLPWKNKTQKVQTNANSPLPISYKPAWLPMTGATSSRTRSSTLLN